MYISARRTASRGCLKATIMPRRELSVTGYLKAIVVAIASSMLASCSHTELDRIYDQSRQHSREITFEEMDQLAQWRLDHERWRRDGRGTAASEPLVPALLSMQEKDALRMRFMERRLLELIGAQCPDRSASCTVRALQRLGFACSDGAHVMCALTNMASSEFDLPTKRIRERHSWTVMTTPDGEMGDVQARVEIVDTAQ